MWNEKEDGLGGAWGKPTFIEIELAGRLGFESSQGLQSPPAQLEELQYLPLELPYLQMAGLLGDGMLPRADC